MSTRSNIGMVSKTGKTAFLIYCHYDGYPSVNGKILLEHYQDETKVKQLIQLGDLSCLGAEIGKKHNFDECPRPAEHENWTISYGRDRGEKRVRPRRYSKSDLLSWKELCQEEYLYLWMDGAWWFTDGNIPLIPLTMELCRFP